METDEPIRVLIVDDSRIFRGALQAALELIPNVKVVGSVYNGQKALDFIDQNSLDLVTLDVEMPGLSGLETLKEIQLRNQRRRPLPPIDTILVSALTQAGARVTVEGLQLGAVDFLAKPIEADEQRNRDQLRRILAEKLSILRNKRGRWDRADSLDKKAPSLPPTTDKRPKGKFRAIAIGTSTGGPEALSLILPQLAKDCAAPIFVVQHILDGLSYYLAESLSKRCGRLVIEASDGIPVQAGGIYLAKSGKHMLLRSVDNRLQIGLTDGPPEKGCKPAVDVFLRSAAIIYGSSLVAAILTGMGEDGTDGVRAVKRSGGYIIAQDEESSVVWGMPRAAVATGLVDLILPLDRIADRILRMVNQDVTG